MQSVSYPLSFHRDDLPKKHQCRRCPEAEEEQEERSPKEAFHMFGRADPRSCGCDERRVEQTAGDKAHDKPHGIKNPGRLSFRDVPERLPNPEGDPLRTFEFPPEEWQPAPCSKAESDHREPCDSKGDDLESLNVPDDRDKGTGQSHDAPEDTVGCYSAERIQNLGEDAPLLQLHRIRCHDRTTHADTVSEASQKAGREHNDKDRISKH